MPRDLANKSHWRGASYGENPWGYCPIPEQPLPGLEVAHLQPLLGGSLFKEEGRPIGAHRETKPVSLGHLNQAAQGQGVPGKGHSLSKGTGRSWLVRGVGEALMLLGFSIS